MSGRSMHQGALQGAATRNCPDQIRLRSHQVEAKIPAHPATAMERSSGRPRRAVWAPNDTAKVVVPLASLDARRLPGQITKATGGLV